MAEEKKTGATGAENTSAQSGANPGAGQQNETERIEKKQETPTARARMSGKTAEEGAGDKDAAGDKSAAADAEKAEKDARNAEYARRRREAERRAEISQARVQAIIDAVGENPYTGEEIKDADDVEEYLAMRRIKIAGGDPIADFHKAVKEKRRSEEKEAEEERKKEDWYRQDREDFAAKHPDVSLDSLVSDESFAKYAAGKVGRMPLSRIYEDYNELLGSVREKTERAVAQAAANAAASPGALAQSQASEDKEFFSKEDVEKMSKAEVERHLDAIRKSMLRWKR